MVEIKSNCIAGLLRAFTSLVALPEGSIGRTSQTYLTAESSLPFLCSVEHLERLMFPDHILGLVSESVDVNEGKF